MKKPPHTFQAPGALGEQLPLIPAPAFSPSFPTRFTLADQLLSRLLAGESFVHPEWESITGSWRLAATAFQLTCLGWPVKTMLVPSPSAECPNRTIARYSLPASAIAAGRKLQEAQK